MREVRFAYAVAAVLFAAAAFAYAALPPYDFLTEDALLTERSIYDNPMDFEAASKIAVTEEDRVSDTWLRFDAGLEPPRIPSSVLEGTVPRSLLIWYLHAPGSIAAR
jgi:hypothetical protein